MVVWELNFKPYAYGICFGNGRLVRILRMTSVFWKNYKDLLSINNKIESDNKDIENINRKFNKHSKNKKINFPLKKQADKIHKRLTKDFSKAEADLSEMLDSEERILIDDETILYKVINELVDIYHKFEKVNAKEHLKNHTLHKIHSLIEHIKEAQHHSWIVSKRHNRDFINVGDLTIISNAGERRRLRRNTIELDHIQHRITPLKISILRMHDVNDTNRSIIHDEVNQLLSLYHEEITSLIHVMHETDVLLRRTELLFKELKQEAKTAGFDDVGKIVDCFHKKMKKMTKKIETISRREMLDINKLVRSLKAPPELNNIHHINKNQHKNAA